MQICENVVIIVPTYNERAVITKTLHDVIALIKQIDSTRFNIQLLVYDSASPDGTAEIVRQVQRQYPNYIRLLEEHQKSGLGSAYVKAMEYAMAVLAADIVFEYDADGSHQPQYLLDMLYSLQNGADVVVGSRYVPGGLIPANWAWYRRLISTLGNRIARVLLTNQYQDFTSGFRGTRTVWLKKINLSRLLSKNYAYKLHLFWALHELGANIVEVPIEFIDRQEGSSKFPRNNILESLYVIVRLRLRTICKQRELIDNKF